MIGGGRAKHSNVTLSACKGAVSGSQVGVQRSECLSGAVSWGFRKTSRGFRPKEKKSGEDAWIV